MGRENHNHTFVLITSLSLRHNFHSLTLPKSHTNLNFNETYFHLKSSIQFRSATIFSKYVRTGFKSGASQTLLKPFPALRHQLGGRGSYDDVLTAGKGWLKEQNTDCCGSKLVPQHASVLQCPLGPCRGTRSQVPHRVC